MTIKKNQKEVKLGRPFGTYKYTPEEMLKEAEKYFDYCDNIVISSDKLNGKIITKPKTLSGYAKWLGVAKDYVSEKLKDENYSETIKWIRNEVENNIEEGILTNSYNSTSGIFNLKNNFDWKDKSEVDQNTKLSGELSIGGILDDISKSKDNLK